MDDILVSRMLAYRDPKIRAKGIEQFVSRASKQECWWMAKYTKYGDVAIAMLKHLQGKKLVDDEELLDVVQTRSGDYVHREERYPLKQIEVGLFALGQIQDLDKLVLLFSRFRWHEYDKAVKEAIFGRMSGHLGILLKALGHVESGFTPGKDAILDKMIERITELRGSNQIANFYTVIYGKKIDERKAAFCTLIENKAQDYLQEIAKDCGDENMVKAAIESLNTKRILVCLKYPNMKMRFRCNSAAAALARLEGDQDALLDVLKHYDNLRTPANCELDGEEKTKWKEEEKMADFVRGRAAHLLARHEVHGKALRYMAAHSEDEKERKEFLARIRRDSDALWFVAANSTYHKTRAEAVAMIDDPDALGLLVAKYRYRSTHHFAGTNDDFMLPRGWREGLDRLIEIKRPDAVVKVINALMNGTYWGNFSEAPLKRAKDAVDYLAKHCDPEIMTPDVLSIVLQYSAEADFRALAKQLDDHQLTMIAASPNMRISVERKLMAVEHIKSLDILRAIVEKEPAYAMAFSGAFLCGESMKVNPQVKDRAASRLFEAMKEGETVDAPGFVKRPVSEKLWSEKPGKKVPR